MNSRIGKDFEMNNFSELSCRKEIPIFTKMKPTPDGGNVVNYKKEKLYKYYKCDYCGAEIRITDKKQDMTGGVATIPHTVTKKGELKLALCNKCLKPALKEFEEV